MLMIGITYSQLNTNETATTRLIDSNIFGQSEGPYDKKQNNTTQNKTIQDSTDKGNRRESDATMVSLLS